MREKLIKHEGDYYYLMNNKGDIIADVDGGDNIQKLSLKNCQAIEHGYDLDELSLEVCDCEANECEIRDEFKKGFQKALEILGDRRFSEDDVKNGIEYGIQSVLQAITALTSAQSILDIYIQSLQQTEWEVAFDPEEKDSKGNLILKRVV